MYIDFHRGQIETILLNQMVKSGYNYLNMSVKSSLCLKIYVGYKTKKSKYTEYFEIFIEDKEYVFSTLLPEGISEIQKFTIENLSLNSGWFEIKNYTFSHVDLPEKNGMAYIENDNMRVGINLTCGGGLASIVCKNKNVEQVYNKKSNKTYIGVDYSAKGKGELFSKEVNLLNNHDVGRLVQQTYYGIEKSPYQRSDFWGMLWRYNPVQSGDKYNNPSSVIDYKVTSNRIYVKTRPLDWAKSNCPTDSYMESTYILQENYLHIKNKFVDFSKLDHYSSGESSQELPAFYVVEPLRKFVYKSSKGLAYLDNLGFWGDAEDAIRQTFDTENCWGAWVNEENFGIGLFVPNVKKRLCGTYKDADGLIMNADKMNSTNYMAAIGYFSIPELQAVEYDSFVYVGNVEDMQKQFNALSKKNYNSNLKYLLTNM